MFPRLGLAVMVLVATGCSNDGSETDSNARAILPTPDFPVGFVSDVSEQMDVAGLAVDVMESPDVAVAGPEDVAPVVDAAAAEDSSAQPDVPVAPEDIPVVPEDIGAPPADVPVPPEDVPVPPEDVPVVLEDVPTPPEDIGVPPEDIADPDVGEPASCPNTLTIVPSVGVTGTTAGESNTVDVGFNGCTGFSSSGPDVIYEFAGVPGLTYTLHLQPTFDAAFYAVTGCENAADSCIAGADEEVSDTPEVLVVTMPQSGQVWLVVDAFDADDSGSFEITFGATNTTVGTCDDAEIAFVPFEESGTTIGAGASIDPGAGCAGAVQPGPEAVYRPFLFADTTYKVTLVSDVDASVYVATDCSDAAATCEAGADETAGPGTETFTFTPPTTGSTYVIVDSGGELGGSFTLSMVEVSPPGDDCTSAPFEIIPFTVTGTTVGENNSFDPGSGGCTGFAEPGADSVYEVFLSATSTYTVTMTPETEGAVYIVSNCEAPAASCVAGADENTGALAEVLTYTPPSS
ncbi:MAG: hypothetical protein ACI9OJ_005507, partial [Myxococcota bacterium]